jgi:phospholipid-transporting ATPase
MCAVQDADMYDEASDTPAVARTSNLNEELGQVKYVLTDKTGTLTQNVMLFKQCSVGGIVYGSMTAAKFDDPTLIHNMEQQHVCCMRARLHDILLQKSAPLIRQFLTAMALCHTVVPNKRLPDASSVQRSDEDEIVYTASSPDEVALVRGARDHRFVFHTRTAQSVTINVVSGWLGCARTVRECYVLMFANISCTSLVGGCVCGGHIHECVQMGTNETYDVLNVLEFTSNRKRMGVVVRCAADNTLRLYVKGADSVICERLDKSAQTEKLMQKTMRHLDVFAQVRPACVRACIGSLSLQSGLRTLCFAMRSIDLNYYEQWNKEYHVCDTTQTGTHITGGINRVG